MKIFKYTSRQWGNIIITVLLLMVPNIIFVFVSNRMDGILKPLYFLLCSLALVILPFFVLYRHIRIVVTCYSVFVFLVPLAIFYTVVFSTPITPNMIATIMDTNYQESIEFFSGWHAIITVSMFFSSGICILLLKQPVPKIQKNTAKRIIIACLIICLPVFVFKTPHKGRKESLCKIITHRLTCIYPFGLITAMSVYIAQEIKYQHMCKRSESFSFHAARPIVHGKEAYVLVIGESARYCNWGINGYYRNTSPCLERIKNLLSFTNVSTGSILTDPSVPMIVTRGTPKDISRCYTEKGIISAFAECGFATFWISSQACKGLHDLTIAKYAKEANTTVFINPVNDYSDLYKIRYDEELIPVIRKAIYSRKKKLFIVVHTMGSHARYSMRYPKQFDVFKPSGKGKKMDIRNRENKRLLVNSYDNSIMYTDFVLNRIIKELKSSGRISVLIYLSDHGENLFDNDNNMSLHWNITPYTLHVPLFVWASDLYIQIHPDKWKNLKRNIRMPVCSAVNIFPTLLNLADITCKGCKMQNSLASSAFMPRKRYYLSMDGKVKKLEYQW